MAKTVLVTGSSGLLGDAIQRIAADFPYHFHFSHRQEADLEDPKAAFGLIQQVKPDCILHLAAKVGGIKYNRDHPEEILKNNTIINENVLKAAFDLAVPKTISFLSTCILPVDAPEPWNETMIHDGPVDQRHWGYATAKRNLDLMSQDLTKRSQSRLLFTTLTPSTLFGLNDNYDLEQSHVIPALILKISTALAQKKPPLFWGTGRARREFLFADDMARIAIMAIEKLKEPQTVIVSPGLDFSIKELVTIVAKKFQYTGPIEWDTSKDDGRLSRRTDIARFKSIFGPFVFTNIEVGLERTIQHFKNNAVSLRGMTR